MASGSQHYRKAEELLAYADAMQPEDYEDGDYTATRQATAAEAQVHATLALAAATALGNLDEIDRGVTAFSPADRRAAADWARATLPSTAGA